MGLRLRPAPHAAMLAALILMGAACSADSSTEATGPQAGTQAEERTADEASFALVAYQGEDRLGGSEITFGSLLGQGTPVVLNFWAAQCPPCRVEMPSLQVAYEACADDVLLVGIDVGPFIGLGTNEQGAELLDELGISYPAGYAVDDAPLRELEILSMPSTVFFNAAGQVVGTHAGIMTEQQIEDWFADLAAGGE